jgi:hypothetical protein
LESSATWPEADIDEPSRRTKIPIFFIGPASYTIPPPAEEVPS